MDVLALLRADGPAAEHRDRLMLYGQFVGSWSVDVTWYEQGSVSRTAVSEWHFGWILGGRGIQDVLLREGAPADEFGTTLRCYDPASGIWHVTWMQPASGEFVNLAARGEGDRILQEVLGADPQRRERWTFSEITPTSFTWSGEVSRDRASTWILQQQMKARRTR